MDKRPNHDYNNYYKIIEGIGNGAFGMVYKGREIKSNDLRAIKVIHLNK